MVDLTPAEHVPDKWPVVLRRLHLTLAAVAEAVADDRYVLAAVGPAVLGQLPWLPTMTGAPLRGVFEVAEGELERLDALGGPGRVEVLATVTGRGRHLLLCVPVPD